MPTLFPAPKPFLVGLLGNRFSRVSSKLKLAWPSASSYQVWSSACVYSRPQAYYKMEASRLHIIWTYAVRLYTRVKKHSKDVRVQRVKQAIAQALRSTLSRLFMGQRLNFIGDAPLVMGCFVSRAQVLHGAS